MTSTEIFLSVNKVAGCWLNFSNWSQSCKPVAHLAHPVKHAVGPVWDIDRDLCSAQLSEGLGVQDEKESTFLLETETEEIKCVTIMIVKVSNHLSSPCIVKKIYVSSSHIEMFTKSALQAL